MIGPDVTYQYAQPKDVAGGTLLIKNDQEVIVDIASTLTSTLVVVAADKVFILTAVSLYAKSQTAPGIATAMSCTVEFESVSQSLIYQEPHGGTQAYLVENWTGQVWLPPNSSLKATASFDEAINTHVLRFAYHGILIPRGNVQQG